MKDRETMFAETRRVGKLRGITVATAIMIAVPAGTAAGAGTWGDPGTSTFNANPTAGSVHDVPPLCNAGPPCNEPNPPGPVAGFIPGLLGKSYGRIAVAECDDHFPLFNCHWWGWCEAWTVVDGIGSSTVAIQAEVRADTSNRCECPGWGPIFGAGFVDTTIQLRIDTVPVGQPVQVHFAWYALLNRSTRFEGAADDPAQVTGLNQMGGVRFEINNTPLVPAGIAVDGMNGTPNATLFFPGNPAQSTGVIAAQGGDIITIDFEADVLARIAPPPMLPPNQFDQSNASFYGTIILSIDSPIPPFQNPSAPGASINEFSVDIGSDREMSDPTPDGSEVFDPGDMYPWFGPALPPGGADGVRDDALAFQTDFWPQAPDPGLATAAATCSVDFQNFTEAINQERYDLDGSDATDIELRFEIPQNQPLAAPLAPIPSSCIHADPYLLISYDDDSAPHYAWDFCDVPSENASTFGYTWGTDADDDEVLMLTSAPIWPTPNGLPQVLLGVALPVVSEATLHQNLFPSPDPMVSEEFDDDVDALDVNTNINAQCDVWYVSADHEATGLHPAIPGLPLDPGDIYEVLSLGGVVRVIDNAIHLGLPDGTDIDAFEFVWLPYCDIDQPANCQLGLALLFSVDEDDFLTAADESGGLDPTMIYASFFVDTDGDLMGDHFPYLSSPLLENVDAIAASPIPFGAAGAGMLVNDDCVNPAPIFDGDTTYTNVGATTDGPIEPCGFLGDVAGNSDADIWFEYVASCDGTLTITLEPQHDLLFAVYHQVCPQQGGPLLICEAAPAGAVHSVSLQVVAGETYILRVGGGGGSTGSGLITIDCTFLVVYADVNGDLVVDIFDLLEVLANWGPCPPGPCPWDINGDMIVDIFDLLEVLANWT